MSEQLPSFLRPIIDWIQRWHREWHAIRGQGDRYISGSVIRGGVTPSAHAASHEDGGSDEISVAGLSGVLADAQTPDTHASEHESGGSDVLAAFTGDSGAGGTVGYVPAPAAGDAAAGKYLKAGGAWTAPPGGSLTVEEIDGAPSVANVTEIHVTNGTLTDVGGGVVRLDFGSAATDGAAIHDNTASEISAITEKVSPVAADMLIIEDSAAANVKKMVQVGNLPSGGDSTYMAAYASRPAAGNDGDLFLPSDGFVLERDTGAAWVPWGPLFPLTAPPTVASLTWVNQGGASADETYGGIYMLAPAGAGDNLRILKKAAPATPYTITICVMPHAPAVSYTKVGFCWRQSSDGKVIVVYLADAASLYAQKYNSPSSYSAAYGSWTRVGSGQICWLRLTDNGTNRLIEWSIDGQHWIQLHSVGRTDFLTADEVGVFVQSGQATFPAGMTLLSWSEA